MMEVLKDKDCTMDTPVVLGVQDSPIYGKGISIKPRVDGRKDSKHFESIYLPELLPLEEYDLIVVLIVVLIFVFVAAILIIHKIIPPVFAFDF